jgi:hypothetical protein
MKTRVFFPLLLLMLAITTAESFASNWYVAKQAKGSNNGTDWNNAWNELNQIKFSSVACGDTVWIAGGTYTTAVSLNKTCTAGAQLFIKKVLVSDSVCTSPCDATYETQVILNNAGINVCGGSY